MAKITIVILKNLPQIKLLILPVMSDLDVYNEGCYDVDLNHDLVNLVCDTPEVLFIDVIRYLKEEIERCSGLHLDEIQIGIHLS